MRLKTTGKLEFQAQQFIEAIRESAETATLVLLATVVKYENCYSLEILNMLKERRKARKIWQKTRNPENERTFNRTSNQFSTLIEDHNKRGFFMIYF